MKSAVTGTWETEDSVIVKKLKDINGLSLRSVFGLSSRITGSIIAEFSGRDRIDLIISILRPDNAACHLAYAFSLLDLGIPVVIAADETDSHNFSVDTARLEEAVRVPVFTTANGLDALAQDIKEYIAGFENYRRICENGSCGICDYLSLCRHCHFYGRRSFQPEYGRLEPFFRDISAKCSRCGAIRIIDSGNTSKHKWFEAMLCRYGFGGLSEAKKYIDKIRTETAEKISSECFVLKDSHGSGIKKILLRLLKKGE